MRRRLAAGIALHQLMAQPHRLVGGLIGVGAAVVLLMVQIGLRDALYESAVRLHRSLDGDLVVTSARFVTLSNQARFPIEFLFRASAVSGVASARPLYTDAAPWRNPATGITRLINVFGFDPDAPVLLLPEVRQASRLLLDTDAVLFDRLSRREFGPVVDTFERNGRVDIALSVEPRPDDPHLHVVGLFTLGPSFVVDGSIVASDLTFHRLTSISLDRVTFGLVRLKPGTDATRVQAELAERLGPQVRVLTKVQLIDLEKTYWANNTAIGFIFDLGLMIGFVIGVVFDYQVLYTLIHDHVREYAVLKSLGYTNGFLRLVVLAAALTVGVGAALVFAPVGLVVCAIAASATSLDVRLDAAQMATVAVCVPTMGLLAALAALRRLRDSDPIDLFG